MSVLWALQTTFKVSPWVAEGLLTRWKEMGSMFRGREGTGCQY